MSDYSYQDMLKMQEEAAIRVREMKKRAALAMEEEPISEEPNRSESRIPDQVKRISYPVEFPEARQPEIEASADTYHSEASELEKRKGEERRSFFQLLTEDKDATLVILLLILMRGNSADFPLSAALIYLLL